MSLSIRCQTSSKSFKFLLVNAFESLRQKIVTESLRWITACFFSSTSVACSRVITLEWIIVWVIDFTFQVVF